MSPSSVSLHRQTFRKNERLCSRKILQDLILKGNNIHESPIRLVWFVTDLDSKTPVQTAFAVPKRNFKNAVDRNRLKRRMREAFRKNKSTLYSLIIPLKKQYAFLLVFTGKEIAAYPEIEKKIISIINRFVEAAKKNNS